MSVIIRISCIDQSELVKGLSWAAVNEQIR